MIKYVFPFLLVYFCFSLSDRYHTFYEIEEQLIDWEGEFSQNITPWPAHYPGSGIIYQLYEIGRSTQDDLPIWAVKLSYDANLDEDEPRVLILGQCHAEEIYGVEIAMELIDWLLHPNAPYPVSYTDRKLSLENTELWIVPTHNPEGLLTVHGDTLEAQWVQDEYYRKNKNDVNFNLNFDYVYGPGNDSDGVDLNRNYDFNWIFGDELYEYDSGCSENPSYQSDFDYYRGEAPFSEREIESIRDLAIEKNFLLSIAYHSSRSGCVSEQVIYPWLWEDDKPSPDFQVVHELGQTIAGFIPTEDGITTYASLGSKSRRGNAHDWFYAKTGCIQYLIEAGTSNIQPDSLDLIEDTIDRNLIGAFHLINRASGNNSGFLGADKYMIEGIVTDNILGNTLNAKVKILEMDGPMLSPRLCDEFGRYRRLLTSGTFTLEVSKKGYETYLEAGIVPSSVSFVTRDIALNPLPEYTLSLFLNVPESFDEDILLYSYHQWGIDTLSLIPGYNNILLYEGDYEFLFSSEHIIPIHKQVSITENQSLEYNLHWAKVLHEGLIDDEWIIQDDSDWFFFENKLYSQESKFYSNDYQSTISLNNSLEANNGLVTMIELQYETEWENDIFSMFYINSDSQIVAEQKFDGHQFNNSSSNMFFLDDENENYSFNLEFYSDPTLNYRGIIIETLKILTTPEGNCDFGDIDFNGKKDILDLIQMIELILSDDANGSFEACVADMNMDQGINIQDVVVLAFLLLNL